jgi:hypothetical protein
MKEQGKQDDIRREGRQGAKTLSAHTVERTMCRARAVLAFSDEYDLSGRANMGLGETVTSERNRASEVHQADHLQVAKGSRDGIGWHWESLRVRNVQ